MQLEGCHITCRLTCFTQRRKIRRMKKQLFLPPDSAILLSKSLQPISSPVFCRKLLLFVKVVKCCSYIKMQPGIDVMSKIFKRDIFLLYRVNHGSQKPNPYPRLLFTMVWYVSWHCSWRAACPIFTEVICIKISANSLAYLPLLQTCF